ncbi:MAG: lytic transglycosylase domain-containing protein [Acidobacteriota bacterium]|nr:lytic transglycosylase domain-containing protein [Acidobacteriota bacterium]
MRKIGPIVLVMVLATTAWSGDRVFFHDGRALEVESWQPDGPYAVLVFEGGGAISVPLTQIARIKNLPDAPETVVAPTMSLEWRSLAGEYADAIESAAVRHGVDPALLAAMAQAESAFDPYAVSHKGACGMLQLMPATAERFGVEDVFDLEQNLDGGARYMRWLLDRFDERTDLALAAYNAGETAVDRYGGIPPYRETRNYVSRILGNLR